MLEWTVAIGPHAAPLGSILRRGEGLSGRVWETGEPLIVDDYRNWEGRAAIYEGLPFTAVVGVPIRWGDEFLGVLNVRAEPPRTFSTSDAELLNLFAAQAAIAIRNARLLQAEREQRELAEGLTEAAAAISSVLAPDKVLDYILDQVERIVVGDAFSIMLIAEDGIARVARWRGHERMGLAEEEIVRLAVPVADCVELKKMVQTGEPLITTDAAISHAGMLPEGWERVRSLISAPIRIAGRTVGFLNASSTQPGRFDSTDPRRLQAFADHAATAIENARLHRELEGYAERLEQRVQERTAELQAQYARLDAILRSASDGIIVTNKEGGIARANPVAQSWLTKTLSREDAERLRGTVRDMAACADAQPTAVLELKGLDLELEAAPVSGEEAEEVVTVVAAHDVSHLKTLDRMKTIFINNVSHELRTPITTVQLYAYLVRQTPPEDEKWSEYLDTLAKEADAQAQLGEDILQISRMYAGRMETAPRPISLNELGEATVAGHQTRARERELTLDYRPMEPGPVVSVDPKQMLQALNNLVGDAIHYTPKGGQVVVSTGQKETDGRVWATVTVSDMGEGIPAKDQLHTFERFFREEEPQSARVSETGLRLMIVKGAGRLSFCLFHF